MKPLALIDLDILTYRCGFAAQHNEYTYADGSGGTFRYKKDMKEAVGKENYDEAQVTKELIVEPVEFALGNVKTALNSILASLGTESYIGYLTGKGNWRDDFAKIRKYKGNRDEAHKPVHYAAIREYLINHWDAIVVEGEEADDAIAREHD